MRQEFHSLTHPLVKHLVRLRTSKQWRADHQTCLLEGYKPLREIVGHRPAKRLLIARDRDGQGEDLPAEEVYLVPYAVIQKIAGSQQPGTILAEVPLPPQSPLSDCRRVLALDGVADPGNAGTLLRTALALGWDGAFLTDDAVDPFNDKALRASRGALFRLPYRCGSREQLLSLAAEGDFEFLYADLKGERPGPPLGARKLLLSLGNEAHGPSSAVKNKGRSVTIPMRGKMESLNVAIAGGILMYCLNQE